MLSYRGMAGIKNVHRALQSTADTVQFNQTLGFWRLPDVAHIRGEKGKTQCQDEFRNLSGCVLKILNSDGW